MLYGLLTEFMPVMAAMNEQDPIMIFAGYDKSMNEFMAQNAGLLRRFGYQFKFDNYDALSIAKIFALKLRKSGAYSPDYLQTLY